ncbi:MAG: hypothetical protein M3033_04710 [Acidobacteriota bacterium]|nr:hypothetical protein [Acidobacteriota bacterium]
MKIFARAVSFMFLSLVLTFSAFAQGKESKDEMYGKIAKLTQTKKAEDADKAYQMSKDFLAKYGKDDDEKVKKIKAFAENYRNNTFNKKLDEVKTGEAIAIGKEILVQEPENSYVTMNLAYAGFDAQQKNKDNNFGADSIAYAKQTISLLDAGKLPKTFQPFKDQAEATAFMYYVIGNFSLDTNLKEAAENFYKAIGYESKIKTDSFPYYVIAAYYEKEYAKQAADFKTKYEATTTDTPEIKEAQAKLDKLVGNMLDAYARAIKFGEAEKNPSLATWKQRFTDVYKFLKKSDAGISDYLASEPNTPLPDPNAL